MEATPIKWQPIQEVKMADNDEFEYDEIRGAHGKKSILSALNKKKLSSEEMDEIFL